MEVVRLLETTALAVNLGICTWRFLQRIPISSCSAMGPCRVSTGRRPKRRPKKPMRSIFSRCARARFGRIHSNRGFQACHCPALCSPGQCTMAMWQHRCAPIGCSAFSHRSFLCFDLEDIRVRANSAGSIIELVGRDLELVAVGIMKIDGGRNLVILEFEFDSALFEFALCSEKIFAVRAKGEVKHLNFAVS